MKWNLFIRAANSTEQPTGKNPPDYELEPELWVRIPEWNPTKFSVDPHDRHGKTSGW